MVTKTSCILYVVIIEGDLVALSRKAQSATAAEIWLWQIGTWKAVGQLKSHALTVTQMEFSHDDELFLTVSRDRHFFVFKVDRAGPDGGRHQLLARQEAQENYMNMFLESIWL